MKPIKAWTAFKGDDFPPHTDNVRLPIFWTRQGLMSSLLRPVNRSVGERLVHVEVTIHEVKKASKRR